MAEMLLVGGVADGHRYDIPDTASHWNVEFPMRFVTSHPSEPPLIRREIYRRTLMCHQVGKRRELIEFFRCDGLSEYDALRLMVLNYQRPEGL